MLYQAYEARRRLLEPTYCLSDLQAASLDRLPKPLRGLPGARASRAVAHTVSTLRITHDRPAFGVEGGTEEIVHQTAFGSLLRFVADDDDGTDKPRVLVIPGLAGHFATLVRGTIQTLLPDHDVYVTDFFNARDVPKAAGRFGLAEYVQHLMDWLDVLGPGTHVMAVCQPSPATLVAAALMAEDEHPARPASLTLMAGPVDTRVSPGPVNQWATRQKLVDLERYLTKVTRPHKGAGRRVYPGFLQVTGFVNLDPWRHAKAIGGQFRDTVLGRDEQAERVRTFYDEYFAVLDIAAEFYLETAKTVFMEHEIPRGVYRWRGQLVDLGAIESPLLTIEGGADTICPPGQTSAAHGLCTGIPAGDKHELVQPGVGHYGVFSGSRFEQEIYPQFRDFVAAVERRTAVS